jgi:hypothetical protein
MKLTDILKDSGIELGKVYTDKDRPPFQVNEGKADQSFNKILALLRKESRKLYVKQVAQMTDRNNHTEARLLLSKMMKNKKLERFYKAMLELNDVLGGYPPPLSKVMSEMDKDLYRNLIRNYKNYDEIYNAL